MRNWTLHKRYLLANKKMQSCYDEIRINDQLRHTSKLLAVVVSEKHSAVLFHQLEKKC